MTDTMPLDMTAFETYPLELTASEVALIRTALRLLESTLGRDEADELVETQALLARIPDVDDMAMPSR